MPARVVVVGSINMDLVVRAPRHPRPGETVTGDRFATIPGGKGANQAVAAARMGASVLLAGAVGQDSFGDALLQGLSAEGIETTAVKRVPEPTGVALITIGSGGENTIVVVQGANNAFTTADLAFLDHEFASADAVVLQLEIPLAVVHEAARRARANGVRVILNPGPAQPVPDSLLQLVDYVIPNEHEAALIAGGGQDDPRSWGETLLARGARAVIITLGSEGALVVTRDNIWREEPFDVKAVDTTAAGDTFVGAFAVAISEGSTLAAAVRRGNAAGALACTVLGAQPSIPTRAAVESLLG